MPYAAVLQSSKITVFLSMLAFGNKKKQLSFDQ
jgi:hypothetical protein